MTSIFYVHNHPAKPKQNPILRTLNLLALLSVIAIPLLSRQAFASGAMSSAQLYIDGKVINVATEAKTVQGVISDAGYTINESDRVEPGLDTEIGEGYRINVYRAVPITIQDKGQNLEIETAHKTPAAIATEAGLEVSPEDKLNLVASDLTTNELKPGLTLTVDRATTINFNFYGQVSQAKTQSETVEEFLNEKQIKLQEGDVLLEDPSFRLSEGSNITIRNDSKEVLTLEEEIAMPIEQIKDVNKNVGFKEVQKTGSKGLKKVTYDIAKVNGREVSRTVLEETIITPAVQQVEIVGAKKVTAGANVSAQAKELMAAAGISESQWSSAYSLINKESKWNPNAQNRSSTAYGLAQFLDSTWKGTGCTKSSDPVYQLKCANTYVTRRYKSWDGAWSHSQRKGWY